MRFGQIARLAAPITDRALSQALALLVDNRLVRTSALPDRPPADLYCAAPRAATLLDALDELAA
jgi:DNA-binding HxlR family transcriptional regulator